jgi:hypothetical protein
MVFGAAGDSAYKGLLDEVAIYSRALSTQEIVNLYAHPIIQITSPTGLTNKNNPLLNYTIVNGAVTAVNIGGQIISKVSGDTLDILSDGTYTLRVEAVSSSGAVGSAETTFTVDTALPNEALGRVALWHLDGDGSDASGNGNDLSPTDSSIFSGNNSDIRFGAGAAQFDGTNDKSLWRSSGNNIPVGNSPRTVMAWIKPFGFGTFNMIFVFGQKYVLGSNLSC